MLLFTIYIIHLKSISMIFFYFNQSNYLDKKLSTKLEEAAQRLFYKLNKLEVSSLNISDYNKKYLSHHIKNVQFSLQLFCHILYHAFENKTNTIKESTLVDYGGGTGLLGLLAAELGVKKIIYVDFYEVSVEDAGKIAQALLYENVDFVHGEVSNLLAHVNRHVLKVDVLVSSDVIEHIYKLEDFFEALSILNKQQKISLVLQTASNIKNPIKRKELEKYQLNEEFKDRENKFGHKQMDSLQSYYKIRKGIIKDLMPDINENELHELSSRTRGLRHDDIEKTILLYQKTKVLPTFPKHKTNTCDPHTGNWTERLMEFEWLEEITRNNGFEPLILKGYYGRNFNENKLKIFIKNSLNLLVLKLGMAGFNLAPYIIIKSK